MDLPQNVEVSLYEWYNAFRKIYTVFQYAGHDIRIVGGAVRDILLNMKPHDIDLCTTANPDEMVNLLEEADVIFRPTGIQHGTVSVHKKGIWFEVTSLREDVMEGEDKKCLYGKSFEEDAKRRDLTMNSLSMDIHGKIYDYFNGYRDLMARDLRFTDSPRTRVVEDPLRILRYLRFSVKENTVFEMCDDYIDLFKDMAHLLARVSGPRIWSEVSRILVSRKARRACEHMVTCDIFDVIGMGQIPASVCDSILFEHHLDNVSSEIRAAMLFGLLVRGDEERIDGLYEKWKFSNKTKAIAGCYGDAFHNYDLPDMKKELYRSAVNLQDKFMELKLIRLQYLKFDGRIRGRMNEKKLGEFVEFQLPEFPFTKVDFRLVPSFKSKQKLALDKLRSYWVESCFTMTKDDLVEVLKEDDRPRVKSS